MTIFASQTNVISTLNSTSLDSSDALANGESFTGTWEDVSMYGDVVVSIATDQDGTYTIQFSPDGTNQDSTLTRYHRVNEINVPHRFTITRRYVRVVFTNNSGNSQTYFRMQTSFGNRHPLNVPNDGTLAPDYDATCVRPSDYRYEVAQSLRQGHRTFNKFGYNPDLAASTTETIWAYGGNYVVPTTAETLGIVSSDVADDGDPAGTGARNVYIFGIDENRKYQVEQVTLNGTTEVTTTNQWLGVNRVSVGSAGTALGNVGNITIDGTSTGNIFGYLPAGEGTTQQCIYHVQLQAKGLVDWMWININKISGGGSPRVTVKGWVYSPVSNGKYEVFRMTIDTGVENTVELTPAHPFVLNAGDVFYLEANSNTANTVANARFSLIEIVDSNYTDQT